jgi:hypothetical protein
MPIGPGAEASSAKSWSRAGPAADKSHVIARAACARSALHSAATAAHVPVRLTSTKDALDVLARSSATARPMPRPPPVMKMVSTGVS